VNDYRTELVGQFDMLCFAACRAIDAVEARVLKAEQRGNELRKELARYTQPDGEYFMAPPVMFKRLCTAEKLVRAADAMLRQGRCTGEVLVVAAHRWQRAAQEAGLWGGPDDVVQSAPSVG